MSSEAASVALITGASSGIGREVARQLALTSKYDSIILACRNPQKAEQAKAELEAETGKRVFQLLLVDMSDAAAVRRAAQQLPAIDDLVLNAGGNGGKAPIALTKDGVTEIFAANVLGHAVLTSELLELGKLRRSAIFVGSEAARGVPLFGIERPELPSYSVEEFTSLCDGSFFRGRSFDGGLAYAQVKLVGALWLSAIARRQPSLRLLTVSPGNTSGTGIANDFPLPLRLAMKYVITPIVAPLLGAVHDVQHAAARIVQAVSGASTSLASGGFYASEPKSLTGPLVEQSRFFKELADHRIQDNAATAVELCGARSRSRSEHPAHLNAAHGC